MNSGQMNSIANTSAPSSPPGTAITIVSAGNPSDEGSNKTEQQSSDSFLSRLARSKSLDELSPVESPPPTDQPHRQTDTGLKVRIKTNSITTKSDFTATNDSNNNTNNKSRSDTNVSGKGGFNNKTSVRKNKPNNGDSSDVVGNNIDAKNIGIPCESSNISKAIESNSIGMSNHETPSTENGKQLSQSQQSKSLTPSPCSQPSQAQPTPIEQQSGTSQTQSQQPNVATAVSAQQTISKTPQASNSPATTHSKVITAPPEQKPKTTRTRKPPSASAKNSTATNIIPKPETKRKLKAKQNAESKTISNVAATLTSNPNATQSTTLTTTVVTSTADKKAVENQRQTSSTPAAKKRKPRSTSVTESNAQPTSPPKRTRKKKTDQLSVASESITNHPTVPTNISNISLPLNVANPQLLTVASSTPMGLSPTLTNMQSIPSQSMQPLNIHSNRPGMSPLDVYDANRLYMTMPYPNPDPMNASSLTRPSLSRLFTSSSSAEPSGHASSHPEEIAKAFEELKDNVWGQVSRSVIELAQHFDIPSLIGTLYTLRQENEKLVSKVRDLTAKRDQLIATNARFDLPGPLLTQHLSHTSPNFSSVVASLTNSPKSLANSSPSPAMNKSPLVPGSSYNHVPPGGSLGPPGYGRNSPLMGIQTQHSGVNSLKPSIPLPSPPTGALLAHGANNRAGLMTINNPPYMTNVHPSMSALNQIGGPNTPSSSYYTRQ